MTPDQIHLHLVPHLQRPEEIRLPEVVAFRHVLLDAHVQGVLVEVQVQLPLVLEVVEQQALGHPGPLGDGIGGGLLEGVVPELQHGAVPDQVLPLLGEVKKFRIQGAPSFHLHHTAIDHFGQPLIRLFFCGANKIFLQNDRKKPIQILLFLVY